MKLKTCPKFTVNGEIDDPTGIFYLQPKKTNEILVESIKEGGYIMLQGHRGSGKSTRCLYAIENQLSDYTCIWFSMQYGINMTNETLFWKSFGAFFMKRLEHLKIPTKIVINDSSTFTLFFMEQRDNPIVLFLDEFDLLLKSDEILDSLFGALRSMKSKRRVNRQFSLQSVVIIGPFSILRTANRTLSPFNVTESIQSPYFNEDDVRELFLQFTNATQITLEKGIIEDIFARTKGHPGLTCFCGKKIQEYLSIGKQTVLLSEWLDYAIFSLPSEVPFSWATVGRLKDCITLEPNFSFLIKYFLYSDLLPVTLRDIRELEIAR